MNPQIRRRKVSILAQGWLEEHLQNVHLLKLDVHSIHSSEDLSHFSPSSHHHPNPNFTIRSKLRISEHIVWLQNPQMDDGESNIQYNDGDKEEFHDASDDFPFYDCEESFSERIESNLGFSISISDTNNFRKRKVTPSRKINKLGNDEKKEESSMTSILTDANSSNELNSRETHEADSSLLLTLAGIMIKAISFQIDLLLKCFTFPVSLTYYLFMLVFNPFGLLKCFRGYILKVLKISFNIVCANVSPFACEWFNENKAIWKLGLKCGWGLLWSAYVCAVLVGLLVSAFLMGGLVIRRVVEEPMRMKSGLNFDYTEKSPVAFVPIIVYPGMSHDVHLGEWLETGKASGLRVIPPNHKLQVTVSMTLPESDYNQNLGIFQVRVDFLANDGKTLASSRRPCMLQFKSQPIRLLLTFFKVAPILTGYTSETQNLKVSFKGFKEGDVPTACLRVVVEQRAEFRPGAGIPEIYDASLILESELPFLRKIVWFWKKTLFVWISMMIFMIELVVALLCCKPFVIPTIRLGGGSNGDASQNDRHDV